MGLEFLPICDVLFNVVSLASYFCDVVFDIIAAYTFHTTGHVVWFSLSVISICLSLLACQVLSARWMLSEDRHKNMSRRKFLLVSGVHVAGGGIIWRYSLLFAPIQLEHVKQEMRNLCVLRMIHGFTESMPLLLIQTYIACTSPESVKEVNVISLALSLFNVCWALASFTKNIRSHNVHRLVLTWIGVIFQFIWRLGTITSRVLILILYSTVYSYWVFLVVGLHWITMMLWVLSRYATIKAERLSQSGKVFLSVCVSYIHIFCYLNLEEKSTKLKIATFYSIMLIENILLVILWSLGLESTPYNWSLTNILIGVFAAFLIGLLFMVLYYRFFHVRKLSAHLSYSPNEEGDVGVAAVQKKAAARHRLHRSPTYCSSSGDGPAVTVFNCALNPALRKKKKLPSRSVPPPPPAAAAAATPFWKSPLPSEEDHAEGRHMPREERTAGDGLSYSRTTSVDDIRQKLQEKRDKQMQELRKIETDIASGRIERPALGMQVNYPIPVAKRQPVVLMNTGQEAQSDHLYQPPAYGLYYSGYTTVDSAAGASYEYQMPPRPRAATSSSNSHPNPMLGGDYHRDSGVYLGGPSPADVHPASELDLSSRYRSYRDSSGDQGDVDSCEDASSPSAPTDLFPIRHPPRLPLPLPRNRVVIGGYDHETPL